METIIIPEPFVIDEEVEIHSGTYHKNIHDEFMVKGADIRIFEDTYTGVNYNPLCGKVCHYVFKEYEIHKFIKKGLIEEKC